MKVTVNYLRTLDLKSREFPSIGLSQHSERFCDSRVLRRRNYLPGEWTYVKKANAEWIVVVQLVPFVAIRGLAAWFDANACIGA
jgi:hypothetical protein